MRDLAVMTMTTDVILAILNLTVLSVSSKIGADDGKR